MTRRDLFKMAITGPSIAAAATALMILDRPKKIEPFKKGQVLTAERLNEIVDRLNHLQ